jgi:hypothetical protein
MAEKCWLQEEQKAEKYYPPDRVRMKGAVLDSSLFSFKRIIHFPVSIGEP